MSTLKNAALLSLASICVASSGCVTRQSLVTDGSPTALTSYDANYTETAYRAVQYMLWNARDEIVGDDAFDSTRPVLCAVAVDLNDMNKTTNFGRLMGQSLKTALQAQRSNKIIEVDLRQAYIPIVQGENAGEFLLSRNLLTLAPRFNAGAALVSTYSIALNKVYVTVELINVDQNVIVAAHQFEVPIGPRTWALLTNKELPPEADSILQYRPPQSAAGQMEKPWPFANPS
ncbi:MAG: hypothetical protein EBR10_04775 [Planctomycetes bacterium]|nr:hypothetical protein [Planctomycetota bacterium]